MAPNAKAVAVAEEVQDPSTYEIEHVHRVYDEIASHFSSTRYKPWPVVARFLQSIPTGWVGLDSGTGNGKYLPVPQDRSGQLWTIGLDRSINLLKIAKHAGAQEHSREVVLGDVLDHCWRHGCFDYAISIATIHHLSTPERRKEAVKSLLRCLSRTHGRALIYVWATEQDGLSKRSVPSSSSPGHKILSGHDVFVPWQMATEITANTAKKSKPVASTNQNLGSSSDVKQLGDPVIHNRYYHMFDKGELRQLVCLAALELGITERSNLEASKTTLVGTESFIEIVQDDWERSNYFVELRLWTG